MISQRSSFLGFLLLASLAATGCRVPGGAPPGSGDRSMAQPDGGAASRPAAGDEARLEPSRRPESSLDPENIPQLLAKTRAELEAEREKNRHVDENLIKAQTQLADLRAIQTNTNKELDASRAERDKLQAKVRELQERLVTAALRIAGAERDTLEAKIAYEKAVAAAADGGVIVEPSRAKEPAASQPAGRDAKDSAGAHGELK